MQAPGLAPSRNRALDGFGVALCGAEPASVLFWQSGRRQSPRCCARPGQQIAGIRSSPRAKQAESGAKEPERNAKRLISRRWRLRRLQPQAVPLRAKDCANRLEMPLANSSGAAVRPSSPCIRGRRAPVQVTGRIFQAFRFHMAEPSDLPSGLVAAAQLGRWTIGQAGPPREVRMQGLCGQRVTVTWKFMS